jgi:hypothetical protein
VSQSRRDQHQRRVAVRACTDDPRSSADLADDLLERIACKSVAIDDVGPFVDDFLASNCLLPRQVGLCLDERFYAWACRTPEPRARANARLLERIPEIHEDNMEVIGAPRMQPDERRRPLRRQGGLRVLRAAQARTRKPSPVPATRRGAGGLVRLSRAVPKPENAS